MDILIIGGNRFFGRHLAESLLEDGHNVTLLNRGGLDDGFESKVRRIKADRKIKKSLEESVAGEKWDLIFDQVCYTAEEARMACEIFRNKTDRYVVTSSESIYDDGPNQAEACFDPTSYHFIKEARADENYQEAKRQVEVVFSKSDLKEVVLVRPSLVVGLDDYTGRLKWHLERIAKGLPIYFPDIEIECDFIRSDQAGMALKIIGLSRHVGAVNCTSIGAISLKNFVEMCEKALGKRAVFASREDEKNHSPYGSAKTKTMNTNLLRSLGVKIEPSQKWMEALITDSRKC